MPALERGHGGWVGAKFSVVTDLNGAAARQLVPAIVPLNPPYPVGTDGADAIPVMAGSGNVANATATATIPAVANKTAYITGFDIHGGGATAALLVNPTVTGIISGTRTFVYGAVAGPAAMNAPLSVRFSPPIPASAVNTAIAVSCPALGAGNLFNAVNAYGFYI